jgi:hypothetical protein
MDEISFSTRSGCKQGLTCDIGWLKMGHASVEHPRPL